MGCEVAPARDGFLEDSGSLRGAGTLGCNLITDVNQTLSTESSNYAGQTTTNVTRKGRTKGLPTLVPVSLRFTL